MYRVAGLVRTRQSRLNSSVQSDMALHLPLTRSCQLYQVADSAQGYYVLKPQHAFEVLPSAAELQKELQLDLDADTDFAEFKAAAQHGNVISMHQRIFSDHLTPVLAYRCLVRQDDRSAPSFLFEAVNNGTQQVTCIIMHCLAACQGVQPCCVPWTYPCQS